MKKNYVLAQLDKIIGTKIYNKKELSSTRICKAGGMVQQFSKNGPVNSRWAKYCKQKIIDCNKEIWYKNLQKKTEYDRLENRRYGRKRKNLG